ncbi:unnamed protein product [Linum trigynum]|uniref:Uncharacterized protein n=1 Tax=Linum trigynum TaxID=586398 RepID=A0AAV2CZ20_9ROSI
MVLFCGRDGWATLIEHIYSDHVLDLWQPAKMVGSTSSGFAPRIDEPMHFELEVVVRRVGVLGLVIDGAARVAIGGRSVTMVLEEKGLRKHKGLWELSD